MVQFLQVVKDIHAESRQPSQQVQAPARSELDCEEEAFGRMVVLALKSMPPRAKALAQLKIQEVIFSARFPDPSNA